MELLDLTIRQAGDWLRSRRCSARELADSYLERIARLNPSLNAFIAVTPDQARAEADRADAELAHGIDRGPLHGIPLALKDLFDTAGIRTTGGSVILRDRVPDHDSTTVRRLREAGAVLLGKTNLHEWAYGTTTDNPHFGRTLNPWDESRIPGGSSGGSAAAIAARLAPGALGSDTGGSIRIPSALCGLTGLKPTFGRVSLRGVIPLSPFMDHAGPMAITAEDCALILQAIAGYDPADPASVDRSVPDYRPVSHSLEGLRLALPRGYFEDGGDTEILRAVDEAVRSLEKCGARLIERPMPFAREMFLTNRTALSVEAYTLHREEMERRPEDFGQDVLTRLRRGAEISAGEYVHARQEQRRLTRELELYLSDVDAILTPTTRIAAPSWDADAVKLSQDLTAFTAPFNLTGFPALSVPCGLTRDGLPIGMQIIARRWDEALALRVGHAYQQETDWHLRRPGVNF